MNGTIVTRSVAVVTRSIAIVPTLPPPAIHPVPYEQQEHRNSEYMYMYLHMEPVCTLVNVQVHGMYMIK